MAATTERPNRTYGNWRKPRTGGIAGLGLAPTVGGLLGLCLVVLTMLISVMAALVLGVVLVLVLAPLAVRDRHGRTLMTRIGTRSAWRSTVHRGSHLYRSGLLGRVEYGQARLPGLAATSRLTEAQDSWGRPFALLSYPSTAHHAVVLTAEADGAALVDQDQVDTWVAYWGDWLASLATEPGLVGAAVVIETAPDSGLRLQTEVTGSMSESAPPLAKEVLQDILAEYPAGSASISTRITLTYSGAARPGHPRRTAETMADELGVRLPGLTSGLAMTGAGAARPLTAIELAEAVRTAYDPAVAPLIEQARAQGGTGLSWEQAGPLAAQESWDAYRHDSAYSTTWCMSEAPRGEVLSSVLTGLLAPHPDVARKRVALLYRPHTPASAARIVESDKRDATFIARDKARDAAARAAAEQAAAEEAAGAGVTRFGMLVTATVADAELMPRARAAVENLAAPARVALRPVWGSQASAFAAALPLGLVLPAHLSLPALIRDNL